LKPLQLSSGDLRADRRADYAEMMFSEGAYGAAAELMLGALELAPQWALGWFRLGEMHEAAGMPDAAAEAWRTALKLDPDDHAGAALKLELIGRAPASAAPPSAFVEALFDQYARSFDQSLVGKLGYRVPELLFEAVAGTGRPRFAHAVDLGCGTGLMGERLRPSCDFLEGFDRLAKADLQKLDRPVGKADLASAADVFIYVGALDGIFARVAAALASGGLFAFSVEKHDGPEPFRLRETRRYAHSEGYVRRVLVRVGLGIVSLGAVTIRQDRNHPVEGLIAVARRA
jgi:predicted TPR repeat methyltransferase